MTIYALCDETGAVRYVGQTRNVEQRRRWHRRRRPALTLIVVTVTDEAHADEVERSWIERYRGQGATLLNAEHYRPGRRPVADAEVIEPVTVLLPQEARREVRELAVRTGRKESAMIRRMVMKALECYRAGEWRGE